jgi:hypothetical protein
MSTRSRGTTDGLVQIAQTDLFKKITREFTPQRMKLLDAAAKIKEEEPDDQDLAYMARELVQCTLPHRDPGQVPFWARTNGNVTLSILSDYDPRTGKLVGYPYGSIPRLILFWLTTEAIRRESRQIHLGKSYSGFLRDLGLDPATGGGQRGDAFRVRTQTRKLFASRISFIGSDETQGLAAEGRVHMDISSKSMLWWDPKRPEQLTLEDSWVELGEEFYKAISMAPVPLDLRALNALKRSPLALDLYAWSTYKAFTVSKKGKQLFVPWAGLAEQFGADYSNHLDFKRKAKAALKKIQTVYPGLKLQDATGGVVILPQSRPAIAALPARRALPSGR